MVEELALEKLPELTDTQYSVRFHNTTLWLANG